VNHIAHSLVTTRSDGDVSIDRSTQAIVLLRLMEVTVKYAELEQVGVYTVGRVCTCVEVNMLCYG